MKISIVGLGKLGLPMAVAIANKGHQVIGVDLSERVLETLKKGKAHLIEPQVNELLAKAIAKKRFSVTNSFEEAVSKSELTFICVNTPDKENFVMDLSQVENSCRSLGSALRKKKGFHVIAIASTIVPETIDTIAIPALEETSGKKCGKGFGICSNPVFIALSTVVRDLLYPPVVTIGESDSKSGNLIAKFYASFCENKAPVIRTTPVMAEYIKLAHNAFCTAKMAFINEMAAVCANIPGADIGALSNFFRSGGERAGKFLEAGMGFGGPCFPRDLKFFIDYIKTKVPSSPVIDAIDISNQEYAWRLAELIERELGTLKNKLISVLGLSYKPNSDITERSFSLRLIETLTEKGARIQTYDPKVKNQESCANIEQALQNAECCVIATPWDEFKKLKPAVFTKNMKESVLFDPWRLFNAAKFNKVLDQYIALGTPSQGKTKITL